MLKFKAELYQAVLKVAKKYSHRELKVILGEAQPRVSGLVNGRIANRSVEELLYYAGRLGMEAKAKFVQTHGERACSGRLSAIATRRLTLR